ncbi:sporulation peptidase YabG [Paenalkalicoccus suaedae]|uniref:Sporulation peptidase YabG n=1 Tax=Paenalkalicoccus suaedae TaxID=2592382 RepID=A0A859FBF5_9BACI|nr:sporulation peptidase YabG [Paenalkalicoccus suaedae]QKS69635.1 sporulation peptidase YabG [Paenalkalicoccus suaedae]
MPEIRVGQTVARRSYGCDVIFRVCHIENDVAELRGEDVRLVADAPIDDLEVLQEEEKRERRNKEKAQQESHYQLFRQHKRLTREKSEHEVSKGYTKEQTYFESPGKVLHLDGDAGYLKKCTELYDRLGVPVYGVHVPEKEMPGQVGSLIEMVRPQLLVITGHDAYSEAKGKWNEMKAYRHSKYFTEAVREARKIIPYMDNLVIFAGACQSHYPSILQAGANFASSPKRVNIHALDPVYLVSKISLTPFMERVGLWDIFKTTFSGEEGLGGLETIGCMRRGVPRYGADVAK